MNFQRHYFYIYLNNFIIVLAIITVNKLKLQITRQNKLGQQVINVTLRAYLIGLNGEI